MITISLFQISTQPCLLGKAELMSKGEAGLVVATDVEVYLAKTELVKAVADKGMSSLRPKA